MSNAKIPTYDQFIEPLLRALAEHPEGMSARTAQDAAADRAQLSDEMRQELLPSGRQAVFRNRVGWAHDRLKRARLSQSLRRGIWCLTDLGRDYARSNPTLTAEQITELATAYEDNTPNEDSSPGTLPLAAPAATLSPDDRLEEALREIRSSVAAELLELILHNTPAFFEQLVLDLLHALDYGTSREDLQRVGRSGDGGIDGIISLDRLGLEKVYVQAKRWQNSVGRPEVQSFYGALAGQRAKKGVMITTSRFTAEATAFAASVEGIVLVDGRQLTALMMDHGVGTSHTRVIRVPEIDSDYFEG